MFLILCRVYHHAFTDKRCDYQHKSTGWVCTMQRIVHVAACNGFGIDKLPWNNVQVTDITWSKERKDHNLLYIEYNGKDLHFCLHVKWSEPSLFAFFQGLSRRKSRNILTNKYKFRLILIVIQNSHAQGREMKLASPEWALPPCGTQDRVLYHCDKPLTLHNRRSGQ